MDADTRQRLDQMEAGIDAFIAETDQRLYSLAQQNAKLSEMMEVLGGYFTAAVDQLQDHLRDHPA